MFKLFERWFSRLHFAVFENEKQKNVDNASHRKQTYLMPELVH